jgi:hypothetical protein
MGNPIPPTPVSEYLPVSVIASKKYLNISVRQCRRLCENGFFKSAFKGGTQGRTSKWQALRSEVIAHKVNGSPMPNY